MPPERFILNIGIYVGERFIFMSSVFVVSEEAIMQTEKVLELGPSRPWHICSFDPGRGTSIVFLLPRK